jgi:hypothetical protein
MTCSLPGGYDPANILASHGNDHEEDASTGQANDLDSVLAVLDSRINIFEAVGIFEGDNGIQKIHAMLAKVHDSFGVVPFVLHMPDTTGYR